MDSNGLRIRNITEADNGEYTCRAEVKSEGRYDEKRITVFVHSQCFFFTTAHVVEVGFNPSTPTVVIWVQL